jgi:phage gp16-like protein
MKSIKNHDRSNQLKIIHVAKKQLGLDDDTYRSIVSMICNGRTNSSAQLDGGERAKLIDHLVGRGFKLEPAQKAKSRAMAADDQSKMIRALWLELAATGAVRNSSEASLAAFVKRQIGVSALQWLDVKQASTVIESLKNWLARVQSKATAKVAS